MLLPLPSPLPSSLAVFDARRFDLLRRSFFGGASPSLPAEAASCPSGACSPTEAALDRLLRDLRGAGASPGDVASSSGFVGSFMALAASSSPSVGANTLDRRPDDRKLPRVLARGPSDSAEPSRSRGAAPAATTTAGNNMQKNVNRRQGGDFNRASWTHAPANAIKHTIDAVRMMTSGTTRRLRDSYTAALLSATGRFPMSNPGLTPSLVWPIVLDEQEAPNAWWSDEQGRLTCNARSGIFFGAQIFRKVAFLP